MTTVKWKIGMTQSREVQDSNTVKQLIYRWVQNEANMTLKDN